MKKIVLTTLIITVISSILAISSFFAFDFVKLSKFNNLNFWYGKNDIEDKVEKYIDKSMDKIIDSTVDTTINNVDKLLDIIQDNETMSEKIFSTFEDFDLDDFDITEGRKLVYEYKLKDKMNKIKINSKSLSVKFVESDKNIIQIYSKDKKMDENNLKIKKINQNTYSIDEYLKKDNFTAIIYTNNLKDVYIEFISDSGTLFIEDSIKNLKLNITNAIVSLEAEKSYPIDINIINGITNIDFSEYNADLNITNANGISHILDDTRTSLKNNRQILGNGENKINIESINGLIKIN